MPLEPSDPAVEDDAALARLAARFLPDAVLVVGHGGIVRWVSDATTSVLGYEATELVGSNAFDLLHPDDLAPAVDGFMNTLAFPGRLSPSVYRVRTAAGGWLPMEIAGDVRFHEPGSEVMVVAAREVSHRAVLDAVLQAMAAGEALEEVLGLLASAMSHQLWEIDCVIAYDDDLGHRVAVGATLPRDLLGVDPRTVSGPAPWHDAVGAGEPVRDPDLSTCGPAVAALAREHGFSSCAVTPVPEFGDRTPACLIVWSRDPRLLPVAAGWSEQVPAELCELALERRHHLSALEYAARHDALTGLPNRSVFFAALDEHGTDHAAGRAVLYVDLDGFKAVNDTFGHRVGDAVLVEVGRRLRDQLRPGDLLARLSGDELALLCPGLTDEAAVRSLADRLVEAVHHPLRVGETEVVPSVSVGIAVDADGRMPTAALVEMADRALYAAKRAGRGRWADAG